MITMPIDTATTLRNTLSNLVVTASRDAENGGLSRMLDSIAETAVVKRARVDGLSDAKCEALVRRVRKALGYTYP